MSDIVIQVENLSKYYRLGLVGTTTLRDDLHRSWAKLRGKPDPTLKIGQEENNNDDDHIWALRDISFEVKQGEILGIIGRNGSGKSTLLKILSRVTAPTTGECRVKGRIASLLEVGTGFHPELTGRQNIFLNGATLGMTKDEIRNKFDEMVAFAGVEKFIDTPVKRYSSGMYVRLAFAVAAHLEPEILLLDEVLAVGDAQFQKKCLGKVGNVSKEGRTVLIVSHNMPSIVNLCKRAVLLNDGQIIKDGHAELVVQHYLSLFRTSGGETIWITPDEAPGNDKLRLCSVRILQDGINGPTTDVDISKDVIIQITYWNKKQNTLAYSAIWLKDKLGTAVLSSGNLTSFSLTNDPWYGKPHPIGLFQSTCRIPGNFLNEGAYSITPILGEIPNRTIVLEEDLLLFQVHDTGEMRKEYYGSWLGVVRPKLAWHTEFLTGIE